MPAPKEISDLVERFNRNREAYISADYNEMQLRREFLDPFFTALGWDVENKQGYAEAYKDVIYEDAIKVGGATKAPDYCFRIGGVRKFFVEAKKPSVNLKDDISPAFQLRRYAWSAKLPLSILTDFEEFAVYDCRLKPSKSDKPATGRTLYLRYTDYETHWDEISSIFSKEAVLKGSFDKYAETSKLKKGTAEVDTAFLQEIEAWREMLARNFALRNPQLSQRELNFAVQRTIDRIIFLRICEDRGIETYGALMALLNGERVYKRLCEILYRAAERYNAGLFHFQKEKDRREEPDELTPGLQLDDKPLKEIIKNLYYPDSPYEFSVLSADILGQVYEQFLGKVIRLTSGHRAVVEDKPEVKKAGGVYYTPTYIVDYIVNNTVGKLLEGKTPKQAAQLRLLDPACGSGSFLIGAYQYLLDWHRDWYVNNGSGKWAAGRAPTLYQVGHGDWRLTSTERKRILLNNIYGVDIDPQAVEVTKLSLLLKVLEGENEQTISRQLKMFHERALPDLGNNIKCGNSLIGADFYNHRQMSLLDEEERYRINAFDWQAEFPEITKAGGFDAVMGNPPWGADFSAKELEYLRGTHHEIIVRMIDSYMYFIHTSAKLLAREGAFGMIIPSTFLTQADAKLLRQFVMENFNLQAVINLGEKVFGPRVLNTSTILIFTARKNSTARGFIKVDDFRHFSPEEKTQQLPNVKPVNYKKWRQVVLSDSLHTYCTLDLRAVALFRKLAQKHPKFQDIVAGEIQRGISPDCAEAFIVEKEEARRERLEKEILRPLILGKHISRYGNLDSSTSIIYLTREDDIGKYPNARAHLSKYRDKITCREVLEGKHPWFALHRPRNPEIFNPPKFIGLTTTRKICVALDEETGYYATDALYLFRIKPNLSIQERFVLGVLHSTCFQFLYRVCSQGEQRVIPQIKAAKLYDLPFPISDISGPTGKSRHDRMVKLVERMLALHQQLAAARIEHEKTALQRQIEVTDRQIDALVYDLYELTEAEIKIVEGQGQS
jgi:type I restriction-modification system DNA methylase subunit